MRIAISLALLSALLAGCQSVQTSRQERCQLAKWRDVGVRDGVDGLMGLDTRYAHICGDLFQPGPYQEGLKEGLSRRPKPAA